MGCRSGALVSDRKGDLKRAVPCRDPGVADSHGRPIDAGAHVLDDDLAQVVLVLAPGVAAAIDAGRHAAIDVKEGAVDVKNVLVAGCRDERWRGNHAAGIAVRDLALIAANVYRSGGDRKTLVAAGDVAAGEHVARASADIGDVVVVNPRARQRGGDAVLVGQAVHKAALDLAAAGADAVDRGRAVP